MEVGRRVFGLFLGVLQLFLQVGRLLLHLARHDLLDALDLPRGRDLSLQLRLVGCGGLCLRVRRFPQKTRSSLRRSTRDCTSKKKAIQPHGTQTPEAGTSKD
jgi:hypothetical protein